jgi:hypothetical protein
VAALEAAAEMLPMWAAVVRPVAEGPLNVLIPALPPPPLAALSLTLVLLPKAV